MDQKNYSRVLLILGTITLLLLAIIGVALWSTLRAAPGSQFALARRRWETNSILHYRMQAGYHSNRAQCYYDVEVRQDRIVRTFTMSCLSSAEPKVLTINGLFTYYERYATERVCSPNGCYCEGVYFVRAAYEETLGHPQSITTDLRRNWLDDLLHAKLGVRQCLIRTSPVLESFEQIKITILP